MLRVREPDGAVVLSYLALRRAVGFIAFGLPFALIALWLLVKMWRMGPLPTSISGYYHTGLRNLLVGSLCAASMFLLGCRGYDRKDELAGTFAGLCAIGVAFCPVAPDQGASPFQRDIGYVHYVFAALLFSTLAYFCLVLFRLTTATTPTRRKEQRNWVYAICGCIIIASMLAIAVSTIGGVTSLFGIGPKFIFETTSLLAFGFAWMVKGETFLKDLPSESGTEAHGPEVGKAHFA